MSIIYNLEPKTHGLITLETNFGDIEVELFTKECPKATRNFVQNCLDGFFNGRCIERVEKDFIAVIELPEDEDLCERFRDEFHPRLKFSRRGLLATANTGKDENNSKFFFTLGATPELQNKHTIFGRARGDSVYKLVDLNECQVDSDFKPSNEKRILQTIVVENPFHDLKPNPKRKQEGCSVSDEESDEDPILRPKPKLGDSKKLSFYDDSDEEEAKATDQSYKEPELKPRAKTEPDSEKSESKRVTCSVGSEINKRTKLDEEPQLGSETLDEREKRLREIRAQIQEIKNKFADASQTKSLSERRRERELNTSSDSTTRQQQLDSGQISTESIDPDYNEVVTKIAEKKGRDRQRETKEMIEGFKKKLKEVSSKSNSERRQDSDRNSRVEVAQEEIEDLKLLQDLEKVDGDDWMNHKFQPQDNNDDDELNNYSMIDPREHRLVKNELEETRSRTPEDLDDRKRTSDRDSYRNHGRRDHDQKRRSRDHSSDRKSHKHSRRHSPHRRHHHHHHHRDRDSSDERRSKR